MGTTHDRMKSDLELANRSPHTIREYLRFARAFVAFHHRPAQKMGEAEVRAWLHHLRDNKRVSPHTLKMALAAVRWLYERTLGRPEVVASIPWPKIPQPLTATLTHDEALAVIVAAPSAWVRMAIEIAYASGLRLSEVVRLRVEDIHRAGGVIFVRKGKGSKDRQVPLPDTLYGKLRAYWAEVRPPGPFLFPGRVPGTPMTRGALADAFARTVEASGISRRGRHISFHIVRHSFATRMIERGTPLHVLQRILGHNSILTTVRYLHVETRQFRDLPDLLA